jgi:hypothetical protein
MSLTLAHAASDRHIASTKNVLKNMKQQDPNFTTVRHEPIATKLLHSCYWCHAAVATLAMKQLVLEKKIHSQNYY